MHTTCAVLGCGKSGERQPSGVLLCFFAYVDGELVFFCPHHLATMKRRFPELLHFIAWVDPARATTLWYEPATRHGAPNALYGVHWRDGKWGWSHRWQTRRPSTDTAELFDELVALYHGD